MARRSPVRPSLFDIPIDYVDRVISGEIDLTDRVTMTSPVITFAQNFYLQFFQNVVGVEITSLDQHAKRAAVVSRHTLKKQKAPRELLHLISWFEYFCDIRPDLEAIGYGGGRSVDFRRFLTEDFRTLVDRISKWARKEQLDDVAEQASALLKKIRSVK